MAKRSFIVITAIILSGSAHASPEDLNIDEVPELRACSDSGMCGKPIPIGSASIKYVGCNAICQMANNSLPPKEVKQCRDSTCVECYTQDEPCDPDNPDQCCKYNVQYKGSTFLVKPLCGINKRCQEFCWPVGEKCDPMNYKCCNKGDSCILVTPPDTYSCVSRNSSDPDKICRSKRFPCKNYNGVRSNNAYFCKCPPSTNMATGFGNCDANNKCITCSVGGGSCKTETDCCPNYSVTTICTNGTCGVCIPTKSGVQTFMDYTCSNAKCCDSTKKCNSRFASYICE